MRAKKEARKAVIRAKNKVYERLYQRLETKDAEKEGFKIGRAKERKTRDLGNVRCIRKVWFEQRKPT